MSNILRVAFKHERRIESRPLYQYDYGQVLKFIDLELPYSYEVHFSNHEKGSSITQLGNENGVAIPDSLLTSGLPVYAWLYLHAGDADGETEYMVKIPVYKRAAITNDQPTPVQQDVITQAIAALASGVATATNSAAMAIASASEATAARDGARAYMNIAQASADIATTSAQQAVTAASHYPIIEEDNWYLWSVADSSYVDTGVNARGPKGDPFTYDDFTPEQLEALTGPQGVTFTPTVSPEGVIYWENDGGRENPQAVNIMGPQGIQGEPGAPGADGLTFTPSVSSDGVISWANNGGAANPSSVNIKGPQGEQGIQGEQGVQGETGATFTPSVSSDGIISWTNDKGKENPTSVNIRGPQGIQGVQGETGATGSKGDTGTTFTPAVSSEGIISWTNDDNKENPEPRNIRGPQGEQGIQGETGPSGFSPVIVVSSITGGHQVSITDASGTQSFDVMDGAGSVQSVNDKTGVVVLTAEDVGALPSDTVIPTVPSNISAFNNDVGYITIETDPTVPAWAKASNKPEYSASEIGAIAVPTAASSGQLLGYDGSEWTAVTVDNSEFVITVEKIAGQWANPDKTYAETLAAYNAGRIIKLRTLQNDSSTYYKLYGYNANYNIFSFDYQYVFTTTNNYRSDLTRTRFEFSSSGLTYYEQSPVKGLPSVGNPGQFLRKDSSYFAAWESIYQVPTNGTAGQVLRKNGAGASAYAWVSAGVPSGGSIGQVLAKSSDDDYALTWATPSGGSDKVMAVTITYNSTYPYYSSNKTIDEIFTAIDNGYDVYLIYTGSYSDAAHEIYQLYSRSTTDVYFIRIVVSGTSIIKYYFRIYKSNNATSINKNYDYASIPSVENQYYIVIKYDDSENKYFIDDYLNLSYLAYLDLTSGFYRFGSIFAYYSEEGNHLPETGGYENYADYYYLQKYWNTEEYDEGEDSYSSISHVIFSKIDNTNGTVKFKSFLIEGGSWDNLTDATVTYSEVSLGQPSAAAGVSF